MSYSIFKKSKSLLISLLLLSVVLPTYAFSALPISTNDEPLPSLAPILEKSMPAVVNISTSTNIRLRENPLLSDPFFRHFFNVPEQRPTQKKSNSLGSGVIIDDDEGYVLTNNHVIDKADEILVTLSDGRQLNAKLVGTDPEADIAVIKIPSDDLTELKIADSSQLRVGDFAIAIGNPFGLGQTVTSGIISALGRSGLGIEGYEDFIQTDASINPGNSGGALINLKGELIGINTAILAPSGGNVGIGFAIPSNMAIKLKTALVTHGEVQRGLLGVSTQDLTPELVKAFNLKKSRGAIISQVQANSAAEKAGLEPGDIILKVNDRTIKNSSQIKNMIGLVQIGEKVDIKILRDKETKTITAVIAKPQRQVIAGGKLHPLLAGSKLTNTQKQQVEGVLFSNVESSSKAARYGLRTGDIIVTANRYRVHDLDELKSVTNPKQPLLINIQRGNDGFFVVLQ